MDPVLVSPPDAPLVELQTLKQHLRVDHDLDDALIEAYEVAVSGLLDGPGGQLGRCIRRQTWQVEVEAPGIFPAPVPDVLEVTASAGAATIARRGREVVVTVSEPCTLDLTCGLPDHLLPQVRVAVMILVAHLYEHREPILTGTIVAEVPMSADALLADLRRPL